MAEKSKGPKGYVKQKDEDGARPLANVLDEHNLFASQQRTRRSLLSEIEKATGGSCATIGFISASGEAIDSTDVPALGDVLLSVGDVETLNLIIHSPGGDGTTAEKLIELCRAYCKKFNVIVPNRAKSAATIIALGADEIVMGHCSELGPIDAQVPIVVGGIPRYVSAQSFIDAQETLQAEFAKRTKADPKADVRDLLQQLAVLDGPFTDHCRKLMAFSRDVAEKNLENRMLSGIQPVAERKKRVAHVIQQLSEPANFRVHSRMIDGNTAKTKLQLNVRLLAKDSDLWKSIWQYYIRAEVNLQNAGAGKIIESRVETLFSSKGDL